MLTAQEVNIIEQIKKYFASKTKAKNDFFTLNEQSAEINNNILQVGFNEFSPEFMINPLFTNYIKIKASETPELKHWVMIIKYFESHNEDLLIKIRDILEKKSKEYDADRALGIQLPNYFASSSLIRNIYSSGNETLISLFMKHQPLPSAQLFDGHLVPNIIQSRSAEAMKTLNNLIASSGLTKLEETAIQLQRTFREKKRQQEEETRITHLYSEYIAWMNKTHSTTITAKRLLKDASTPYKPQCEEKLADRIQNAAKNVVFFSTVRHLTATKSIKNIFNDALYGRRHLLQSYTLFRKAALFSCDIKDGDSNVICFGPNEIDPVALQKDTMEIVFDLKKILHSKPRIFYKQRDFGFHLKRQRKLTLGKESLFFTHTEPAHYTNNDSMLPFIIFNHDNNHEPDAWAEALKLLFINYNIEKANQILTLNFFRFIDNIARADRSPHPAYKESIYNKIALLDDEELQVFLQSIFDNLTDTAEFNVYGAYKIDFSAIKNITTRYESPSQKYTLNMEILLTSLKTGDSHALCEAQINIPEIFNSYRFVDYLLSQVISSNCRVELEKLRKECAVPAWLDNPRKFSF